MNKKDFDSLIDSANENMVALIEKITTLESDGFKPQVTLVLNINGSKHTIKFDINE